MKIILETKRLILREMTDDDFGSLKKVISDAKNMKCCCSFNVVTLWR